MRLHILHVPDCPNVAVLEQRLIEALTGCADEVEIRHHVVNDPESAADSGMTGSPTLLVDGVDPFALTRLAPSLSCRLYRDDDGRPAGAPSVAELRGALADASSNISRESCCATAESLVPPATALSRARGRAIPSDPDRTS